MPIYTKTGDKGTTSLFGGKRILKSDVQVECYGTIDELSAFIGFAKIAVKDTAIRDLLTPIQKDLYSAMAYLSGSSKTSLSPLLKHIPIFEHIIDSLDKKLPELRDFIIPQNNEPSTRLHIARTVCRRVERILIRYYEEKGQLQKKIIGKIDLGDSSETGLRELVERSQDLLINHERLQEKKAVEVFFKALGEDPDKSALGEKKCRKALEIGAVEILYLSAKIGKSLIKELTMLAENIGSQVKIISIETPEGEQLFNMGGIGANLRFKVNF